MSEISVQGGNDKATLDNIRTGKRVLPIFIKSGGIPFIANGLQYIHKLSDVQEIADIGAELLNEREHFEGGSECIKINDGSEWTGSVTVEGNALEGVASMIGQDLNIHPAIIMGKTYDRTGHLLLISHDDEVEKPVTDAILITDISIKLTGVPGLTNGDTNYTIEFESRGEVYRIHGGHSPSAEIFSKLDGNLLAPDGVLVDFKLGDGNNSYPVPLAGVADNIILDPDASSELYKYFAYVKLDGVDINPAEATWNNTTKTLTFNTAPADESVLEWAWLVDCSGTSGLNSNIPANLLGVHSFLNNWKGYQKP